MTAHRIATLSNTEASRLTPNGLHSGMDFTIQNINESGNVFVGGEGVTTENYGYRVAPGHAISFELPGKDSMYAIAENNGAEIAIIELGLETGS